MAVITTANLPDSNPVCSVLIANYNGFETLPACIDSVLAQEFGHPIEILVHDDSSSDGSVDLLRTRYPQIKLLISLENVGFCIGNNRLAASACGRYLLLLNNDARLRPDVLQAFYAYAEGNRFHGILGLPQFLLPDGELFDRGSFFDIFLNPVPNRDPMLTDVGMATGACLWLPKALWDELGGFPEWFGSIAEDMYLCLAARNNGHSVRILPASGFDHWMGKCFGGGKLQQQRLRTTLRRRSLSERNKSYNLVLFYPTLLLLAILPLHLVLLALEGMLLAVLKREPEIWRCVYQACFSSLWRERQRLREERRHWQQQRIVTLSAFLRLFQPWPHKLNLLSKHGLPEIA